MFTHNEHFVHSLVTSLVESERKSALEKEKDVLVSQSNCAGLRIPALSLRRGGLEPPSQRLVLSELGHFLDPDKRKYRHFGK